MCEAAEALEVSPCPSPEEALQRRETLAGALELMTERQRLVFFERLVMGRSYREIGAVLGAREGDLPLSGHRVTQIMEDARRAFWRFHDRGERARPRPQVQTRNPNRLDQRLRVYLQWHTDQADRMTAAEEQRHRWHAKRWHIAVGLMNGRYYPDPKLVGWAVQVCHVQWWYDLAPPGAKRPTCRECTLRKALWAEWLRHGARRRLLEPIDSLGL